MIELHKIFADKYDSEIAEWITGKCIEKQYDTKKIVDLHCSSHILT